LIEQKNLLKTAELQRMRDYTYIGSYKYQIYYFARTMEHVIFDDANPNENTKVYNIGRFMDNLDIAIEDYLSIFLPPLNSIEYKDKYEESWAFAFENNNSLQRTCNVPLLFEYVNILSIQD
jgi:hypothetical protein